VFEISPKSNILLTNAMKLYYAEKKQLIACVLQCTRVNQNRKLTTNWSRSQPAAKTVNIKRPEKTISSTTFYCAAGLINQDTKMGHQTRPTIKLFNFIKGLQAIEHCSPTESDVHTW